MTIAIDPRESPAAAEPKPPRRASGGPSEPRLPRKPRSAYPKLRSGSEDGEARRLCAVILEVLGGGRTPTDAAGALGVSVPRYYALEARALGGLLRACQRRPKGRKKTPEAELARLEGEVKRLEGQSSRLQALLRASQRAVGLPPPVAPKGKATDPSKKRKKRRPQVRALRAAASLRSERAENSLECSGESRHDAAEVKA